MTNFRKVDIEAYQATTQQSQKKVTNPVEKEKAKKEKLNSEIQRSLSTKKERKEAVEDAKNRFIKYGKANGEKVSEKDAQKLAKNYVENEHNKENFENTQVFIDKKAYKEAEKAREEQRSKLIEQYKKEGLSKKEAKQKADSQLAENEYLRKGMFGQRKTRKFIEANKDKFYDEKGNFSSDKFKEQGLKYANTNTTEGETTNYHLSLKERRKAAEQEGTNASVIKNIAKKSNLSYEKDNTNLYKGLVIAGATGAGIAAAPIFTSSAAAAAASSAASAAAGAAGSAAASGDAASSASAAAKASTSGIAIGAGVGLGVGLGLSHFVKDKGKTEAKVYEPGKPQSQPTPPSPQPPQEQPTPPQPPINPPVNPPTPPVDCPITPGEREIEYCSHKIQKGEYWQGIVTAKYRHEDGSKLSQNEIKEVYHELKRRHGIQDKDFNKNYALKIGQEMRLYTELNGKKYKVDCDATVKEKSTKYEAGENFNSKPEEIKKYFFVDCNGNKSKEYDTPEERDANAPKKVA